jgi:hypothetical protein
MKHYIYVAAIMPAPKPLHRRVISAFAQAPEILERQARKPFLSSVKGMLSDLLASADTRPSFVHGHLHCESDTEAYRDGFAIYGATAIRKFEKKYGERWFLLNDYVIEL